MQKISLDFFSFYQNQLLFIVLPLMALLLYRVFCFCRLKKNDRKRVMNHGYDFQLILFLPFLIILSLLIMYINFKLVDLKVGYIYTLKEESSQLGLDMRHDDEAILNLFLSNSQKNIKSSDFHSFSFSNYYTQKQQVVYKSLLISCFGDNIPKDLASIFNYYPVSKSESRDIVSELFSKNPSLFESDYCSAIPLIGI